MCTYSSLDQTMRVAAMWMLLKTMQVSLWFELKCCVLGWTYLLHKEIYLRNPLFCKYHELQKSYCYPRFFVVSKDKWVWLIQFGYIFVIVYSFHINVMVLLQIHIMPTLFWKRVRLYMTTAGTRTCLLQVRADFMFFCPTESIFRYTCKKLTVVRQNFRSCYMRIC